MTLQSIFDNIDTLSSEKGYWFVRTDSGQYFEDFIQKKYIGIGWNNISNNDLKAMTQMGSEVKNKISVGEGLDMSVTRSKSKTTAIFNKLIRFKSLRQGDIVIIPSAYSSRLAFGIIKDDDIYTEIKDVSDCPFEKRRKVQWVEIQSIGKLDNIFYQIIKSRHAICDVKKYENYINNVVETLYIKDNFTHFVININTEEDINLGSLLTLIESINELSIAINQQLNLHENIEDLTIKLNLQSPGKIELKNIGKSLIALAVTLASCNSAPNQPQPAKEIQDIINNNKNSLTKIDSAIKQLKIDEERLNKFNNR